MKVIYLIIDKNSNRIILNLINTKILEGKLILIKEINTIIDIKIDHL